MVDYTLFGLLNHRLDLNMTFTQNKKKSTNDNEKPSSECYRPFIVVIFFIFKKVGQ